MKSESFKFRDGQRFTVGEFDLWGLLQERNYPNHGKREFVTEIWTHNWHDAGCPGHRLKLMRRERRIIHAQRGALLPHPPSYYWDT